MNSLDVPVDWVTVRAMAVLVHLMGGFSVELDGRVVGQGGFRRRHAADLVKLLALAPHRRMHREQVMEQLWPQLDPPDAANQLHKAAHFARRALDPEAVSLRSEVVTLLPDREVIVDVDVLESAASSALSESAPAAAESVLADWPGEVLPEDPYAAWAFQPRQRLQRLHRELLRRAGHWEELARNDPTDEEAHLGVAQAFLEQGDRAGALRQLDLLEHVLRDELGVGLSPEAYDLRIRALDTPVTAPPAVRTPLAPRHAALAQQKVHFCRTTDGVRLAYAISGTGPPLVKASTWLTHLDYDWASPVWSHWWRTLSEDRMLVRYDERGSGLSDWDVDHSSFTLEAWVRDLETVVDTLGLDRFPLLGMSQGGPIAVTYAARHPDRVTKLVVLGTCAQATWRRAGPDQRRALAALGELIRLSWGSDEPGFRQVYDAKFLPNGPLELWRAFDELQRRSTSAENAYQLWRAFGFLDASEAARTLDVPTLILHSRDDQVWSFSEAEELQGQIAGSRLVPLDTANHILQADEPAFDQFVREVRAFLDE